MYYNPHLVKSQKQYVNNYTTHLLHWRSYKGGTLMVEKPLDLGLNHQDIISSMMN